MELLQKLNHKNGQKVYILNAPEEFSEVKGAINTQVPVREVVEGDVKLEFVLVFVRNCAEVEKYASSVLPRMAEDGIVWFAYPKKTSKKYKVDLSRDNGWSAVGSHNYEPVRQIAIDEDWSALRFRDIRYIKNFNREKINAISPEGRSMAK